MKKLSEVFSKKRLFLLFVIIVVGVGSGFVFNKMGLYDGSQTIYETFSDGIVDWGKSEETPDISSIEVSETEEGIVFNNGDYDEEMEDGTPSEVSEEDPTGSVGGREDVRLNLPVAFMPDPDNYYGIAECNEEYVCTVFGVKKEDYPSDEPGRRLNLEHDYILSYTSSVFVDESMSEPNDPHLVDIGLLPDEQRFTYHYYLLDGPYRLTKLPIEDWLETDSYSLTFYDWPGGSFGMSPTQAHFQRYTCTEDSSICSETLLWFIAEDPSSLYSLRYYFEDAQIENTEFEIRGESYPAKEYTATWTDEKRPYTKMEGYALAVQLEEELYSVMSLVDTTVSDSFCSSDCSNWSSASYSCVESSDCSQYEANESVLLQPKDNDIDVIDYNMRTMDWEEK